MHLVCFIIRIYHDARSRERQDIEKQTKPTLETDVDSSGIRVNYISGLNIIYDV